MILKMEKKKKRERDREKLHEEHHLIEKLSLWME